MNKEEQEKTDNYLFGLLSEKEKVNFEQRMKEDKAFRKEVELTRQIMESFQMKGELGALKEMQEISSEEEMRAVVSNAEKKYRSTENSSFGKESSRFYWGLAAGMVAGILVAIIFTLFLNKQTQLEKLQGSLPKSVSDSLQNQDLISEYQRAYIDSLIKGSVSYLAGSDSYEPQLLALLKQEDTQEEGGASGLRFTTQSQVDCDSENFRIEWTPVNKRGDVRLYLLDNRNEKIPLSNYENLNYDLEKGFFLLENLEEKTLYFFEIKTVHKTYSFPFITD